MKRPTGPRSVKVVQVIEVKAQKGYGTKEDPAREITQYWDFEGNWLAERDDELLLAEIEKDNDMATAAIATITESLKRAKTLSDE